MYACIYVDLGTEDNLRTQFFPFAWWDKLSVLAPCAAVETSEFKPFKIISLPDVCLGLLLAFVLFYFIFLMNFEFSKKTLKNSCVMPQGNLCLS